jgi:hypothetical protein
VLFSKSEQHGNGGSEWRISAKHGSRCAPQRRRSTTLAAADRTRALQRIAALGVAYIDEIDAPNLREPFSIFNRRQDLREGVYGMRRQQAARKAA